MLFVPTLATPLRDILTHYIATVSVRKRSHHTEIFRIKAIADLLGDVTLGEITPMHVVGFRDHRLATPNPRKPGQTLGTGTVKAELMLLSHVFSTAAAEWGMDKLENPVLKIRKPKPPPGRSRRLTQAEEFKLLRAAARHSNPHFYPIVVMALETACRQGELLNAQWEHVNWEKRTLHLPITKNGDARDVPLSRKAYSILHDHLPRKTEGRIFDMYCSHGIKSSWRVFVRSIGLKDFHFHDLRHCAISSLLERGLNTIEVASISGHRSMQMLKRYAHLSAWKLVEKLDPKPTAKRQRPVLKEHLPAYPAIVTEWLRRVDIDFPDFIDLRISGSPQADNIGRAKDVLLRTLVTMLCEGAPLPAPSPIDDVALPNEQSRIEVIAPL